MHSTLAPLPPLLLIALFITFNSIPSSSSVPVENPFTPRAYLIRYWNKHITNNLPKPEFLLNKASPLTTAQFATFSKLISDKIPLSSTQLLDFCTQANLICFPDNFNFNQELEKHNENVNFATYLDKNFTNYGTDRLGGIDSFKNYSVEDNVVFDTFRRYSRDSTGHNDEFTTYATESNVADQSFNTYGVTATGGEGKFNNYNTEVNQPNLHFTSYSDNSNGHGQSFTEYTTDANSGAQSFMGYGKDSNGAPNEFKSYGKDSNVMSSTFVSYAKDGNGANNSFTSYGTDTNIPKNTFKNYATEVNAAIETFKNYRDESNGGDDKFETYGKDSNAAEFGFENYGQSYNGGNDTFSSYGKDATGQTIDFKVYGVDKSFMEYTEKGVKFTTYANESSNFASKGKMVNKWVEPGKFFREEKLKTGTIMPMPDIRDKMPKRSFLPRAIVSKLPFSTSKLEEMKNFFNTSLTQMLTNSLSECERAPSPGETKRCVSSIEDMIDFATLVLGRNVVVRTTTNTKGSNGNIMLGEVKGINGGNVTKSVSCHQSLYPYLLYYCHSVPKVRVYEADILDPDSKVKINHGVSICHLDTGSWSSSHGAFIALGSGPGKIEVCHWIFENDMTWTIAD